MKAELIDVMGDDLRVANAARVSFDKESEWGEIDSRSIDGEGNLITYKELQERDIKLINYLAKHNHWSPFSHVMITMRETVPIFVARQRFKHVVGFSYNEVSRRYVDDEPVLYYPEVWRNASENKKQGSEDTPNELNDVWIRLVPNLTVDLVLLYNNMVSKGVAPEQARMVLPQSMMTSYYVTGSLAAWARAYKLRADPHAQREIQDLASQWNEIISNIPELKHSWNALTLTS